jgi:hypothetical protein
MSEPLDEAARERALWQRWVMANGGPAAARAGDDSAGTLTLDELTLAAYAEGRLDAAVGRSIGAMLDDYPDLAADVAMARQAGTSAPGDAGADALASVVARASALVPGSGDRVIAFRGAPARQEPNWRLAVRWGALAASVAVVSYLGFALGSNATIGLASLNQPAAATATDELLDPPTGFLGGLNEVSGT